jgi:hypothetical protein
MQSAGLSLHATVLVRGSNTFLPFTVAVISGMPFGNTSASNRRRM